MDGSRIRGADSTANSRGLDSRIPESTTSWIKWDEDLPDAGYSEWSGMSVRPVQLSSTIYHSATWRKEGTQIKHLVRSKLLLLFQKRVLAAPFMISEV